MAARSATPDGRTDILAGTRIKGRIQGNEDIHVLGRVEGQIELEGRLTVEEGGVVKAEVRAERVLVSGTVVGNVTASDAIELTATGRVQGDLRAPTVRVAEGAKFSGLLEVGDVSRIEVAPRPAALAAEPTEKKKKKAQVTGFVAAATPQDERRRKRVVVKKRG